MSLRTSAAYVAVGTGVSRVTGLLRFVALAWALGQTFLADSYNLANTTPNMLYDVVLGGVLAATFIPVFVDHLANRPEDEAFESISAVLSVSIVVLAVTTIAAPSRMNPAWFVAGQLTSKSVPLSDTLRRGANSPIPNSSRSKLSHTRAGEYL